MKQSTIIPIASGKGGVGKSFLGANLSIALAQLGHDTVVIDLDLGGSNLHSYLGLPNDNPGVGDFLKASSRPLGELAVQTKVDHLKFIAGDGLAPFMANITHGEKTKLLKAIRKIESEYILLDLGAGTTFNTLDYFSLSPRGILVATANYNTVMNLLVFLKNLIFRIVDREARKHHQTHVKVKACFNQPMKGEPLAVSDILKVVNEQNLEVYRRIKESIDQLCPRIVLNMGSHPSELEWLKNLEQSVTSRLNIKMENFGYVFNDPEAASHPPSKGPFLTAHPHSICAQGVVSIADRIVRRWQSPIANSWSLLKMDTENFFNKQDAVATG